MHNRLPLLKEEYSKLTLVEKIITVVMLPIFAVVAGVEVLIAKLTGTTYNEVNIVVYYLLIPLSWTVMIDYLMKLPLLTPLFVLAWIIFLWKDPMKFRDRCDWAFKKSVDFLLWFQRIGWSYVVSSVIICVVIPILVYCLLIYLVV